VLSDDWSTAKPDCRWFSHQIWERPKQGKLEPAARVSSRSSSRSPERPPRSLLVRTFLRLHRQRRYVHMRWDSLRPLPARVAPGKKAPAASSPIFYCRAREEDPGIPGRGDGRLVNGGFPGDGKRRIFLSRGLPRRRAREEDPIIPGRPSVFPVTRCRRPGQRPSRPRSAVGQGR
jgi:hypothetical protein